MFRMSPRRQGILWTTIGAVMLLFTIWKPWFVLDLGGFRFPLGVLFVIYGGLQITIHILSKSRVLLTDEEVKRWGTALELSTPLILEELAQGRSVTVVAKRVEEEHEVPPGITQRYIIALLGSIKADERELLIPREEQGPKES